MSLVFPYSEQNGILRSMYNKSTDYYEKDLFIYSSSIGKTTHLNKSAFDFSSSDYCFASMMGFCFKKGNAFITGYELKAANQACRPKSWTFAGSNDRIHWKNIEKHEHEMSVREVYPVPWNHGFYRCFQLNGTPLDNCSMTGVDIDQIEIFGTYFPNGVKEKSCYIKQNHLFKLCYFMHFILL